MIEILSYLSNLLSIIQFVVHYRSGDPQRGLRYLNRAHDAGCEDEDLFVIRCQCHLRLGNFALADKVFCYKLLIRVAKM